MKIRSVFGIIFSIITICGIIYYFTSGKNIGTGVFMFPAMIAAVLFIKKEHMNIRSVFGTIFLVITVYGIVFYFGGLGGLNAGSFIFPGMIAAVLLTIQK